MGIYAKDLSACNYRCFPEYELELSRNTTVLVGRNAVGKTNLVEALQLLCSGCSFRNARAHDLLKEGSAEGRIELSLEGEGRFLTTACSFTEGKKTFSFNGKRTTAAGMRGVLPAVVFCPDHLDMVKRSASTRREAIDAFGSQLNGQYARLVLSYERILNQRNNLLKEEECPLDLLEVWTDSLVQTGSSLIVHRAALLERLRAHMVPTYSTISDLDRMDVSYQSTIGAVTGDREEVAGRFRDALEAQRVDEMRRGMTLVGPHRDDILFTIDGRAARGFASQGQQRSIVLAWKLAEVQVVRDILGQNPLLLLDDVMSELDAARRQAIMSFVEGDIQTVITTTNLGYFSDEALEGAKVVDVHGA